VVLHHADLESADVASAEGLPVTSAWRTSRDCAKANIGPALLRQALADARRKGWMTDADAEALTAELAMSGKL
jgi:hypothetical protein